MSNRFEMVKQSGIGKHVQNLQDLAGVSTDAVVNILDAASSEVNHFIYGTGKKDSFTSVLRENIGGVFKQLTSTITDMIPQFVKDIFGIIKKKLNESERYRNFKTGVKNQLKQWGLDLFNWGGKDDEAPTPQNINNIRSADY